MVRCPENKPAVDSVDENKQPYCSAFDRNCSLTLSDEAPRSAAVAQDTAG